MTQVVERHGVGVITHPDNRTITVSDHVGVSTPLRSTTGRSSPPWTSCPAPCSDSSLGHEAGLHILDGQRQVALAGTPVNQENAALAEMPRAGPAR